MFAVVGNYSSQLCSSPAYHMALQLLDIDTAAILNAYFC